jgi:SAM-dependent methyltransferase
MSSARNQQRGNPGIQVVATEDPLAMRPILISFADDHCPARSRSGPARWVGTTMINNVLRRARGGLRRLLGPKFVKHYVRPRRVKGPRQPYQAKQFFESWHRASPSGLSDSETISATASALDTRYHYNAVENTLLAYFAGRGRRTARQVLDVGSGAGHWIDFYLQALAAEQVVGVEISAVAVEALSGRYADDPRVRVVEADIAAVAPGIEGAFDVINAIGVMFHIVDDGLWRRAVGNLGSLLAADGVLVIGGQFGRTTQNVQFHSTDRFASWEEFREARSDVTLVNKRIRSLRDWRRCADAAGLKVDALRRTPGNPAITTPENNVLVLKRA